MSLQNKEVDAFSMSGPDVFKYRDAAPFKMAGGETKIDGNTLSRFFQQRTINKYCPDPN